MTRSAATARLDTEQHEAVRRYVVTASPVQATTRGGCYRKAWLESKISEISFNKFRYVLRQFGWKPVPDGELWTLEFRGSGV